MAVGVVDRAREMLAIPLEDRKVPKDVQAKLARGRSRMRDLAPLRDECMEFWRGNQYVHRHANGRYLVKQGTLLGENGKPAHRVRTTRNMLFDIVRHEVSAATQRRPAYRVSPSNMDPATIEAAALAEKVAKAGYVKWDLRQAHTHWVTYAVVADEGFVWPYFDTSVAPIIDPEEGIGVGEVRVRVLGPNQVYWERGKRFSESRWHAVEEARLVQEVERMPGFLGGKVLPDAQPHDIYGSGPRREGNPDMVLVTDFLERPCREYPRGRRLTIANDRIIVAPSDFPHQDAMGNVLDEPALLHLSYVEDPDSDRDMGLIRHTLDTQRTINDVNNKQIELKNLALLGQVLAPVGAMVDRLTDEPGAVFRFKPIGGTSPQWRDPPSPEILNQLQDIKQDAIADLGRIAAQNDIPNQVEAGTAIQTFDQRDQMARQNFLQHLAEAQARLMRHCLLLVSRFYTEPRLLEISGEFGAELIPSFRGAQLRNQVNVHVPVQSIEPQSQQGMRQRVQFYAQSGWIDPQKAISAIESGMAVELVDDVSADITWQNHEIQLMKGMATGETSPDQIPEAREFDNHAVHLDTLHRWMKTLDWATQPEPVQEASRLHEQQHKMLLAQEQQQQAIQQTQMAQGLGMANAARPQGKMPPSQPKLAG